MDPSSSGEQLEARSGYFPVTPASSWAFSTCGRGIEMML
jgi:hypothetical protein